MTASESNLRLAEALVRWRNDALAFVREAIRPPQISKDQERLLTAASKPGARVSMVSGTTCGKTAVLSWLVIWFITCHLEARCPCTATTREQVIKRLWPEIVFWHKKMLPAVSALTEWHPESFCHAGNYQRASFAWPMAANKDTVETFQGVHAKSVLFLFDEASGIPSEIWEAAAGSANAVGGRWVVVGNGNRNTGAFYDTHNKNAKFWEHFSASSWDSPFCGKDYCKSMAAEYGEDSNTYRIRVLGQFPKDDPDTLIQRDWVQAAIDRQLDPEKRIPFITGDVRIAGVDPNNGGPDACGFCIRRGAVAYGFQRWRTTDHEQIAAKVYAAYKEGWFDIAHVEANGIGLAVVTVLKRLGVPVVGVDVSRAALVRPRCAKMRDELWWLGREWFQSMAVGLEVGPMGDRKALDDFVHEVTVTKWRELDRIRIETKDELRRPDRLGHSPDVADAFLMTLAQGLRPSMALREAFTMPKQHGFVWG